MGEHQKQNPRMSHCPKLPRIQVPSTEWGSFLMKGLKKGQRCYFYSILSIYDSQGPREALSRRYMINLQRQNVLGLITKRQVEYYASYIKDSKSYRRSKLGGTSSLKADCRRAQLHFCN
ncbi:protein FAM216B [Candoia aspera]|uniref:protein FAM216B n=1 Tax=Candoia aspera TaxID=51853 RepID=UPI002FD7F787